MRRLLFLLLGWLTLLPAGAQTAPPAAVPVAPVAPPTAAFPVRGTVRDAAGQPLAFCNVYCKTTGQNTTANEQGAYQTVALPPGQYEVLFQFVGYAPHTERVTVTTKPVALDITLTESAYNLGEVTVRASDEDPAYGIVRAAIARRKFYRDEISAYRCQTYAKGLGRLTDTPGKLVGGLLKLPPDLKPGIVYLSESVSELTFRQPNRVQERMISSRVSGRSKGLSFNRAAGVNFDFYDNLVKTGFSERGVVSPLANGAFTFYRYRLVGATPGADGVLINKISVEPRHRRDPAFRGFIYIQDNSWRLTGIDVRLDKDSGIEYVDEIRIEQVLGPVGAEARVWRPLSQKIRAEGEAFGFKGYGLFNTVYSQYEVRAAYPKEALAALEAPKPEAASETLKPSNLLTLKPSQAARIRQEKQQNRQDERRLKAVRRAAAPRDSLFPGEIQLRRGEVQRIESEANQRDSAYWTTVRPVPLTTEEARDYVAKDSVETIKNARPYQDSLDRTRNRITPGALLLTGYDYQRTFLKRTFSVPPVFRMLQYNTVEGTVLNLPAVFRQRYENRRYYVVRPVLRYGLADHRFKPSLTLDYRYDPLHEGIVTLEGGREMLDLNRTNPLVPFVNSVYTLLANRNYLKLYERDYVGARWRMEVLNGLQVAVALGYADRRERRNATDRIWRDTPGRALTPNHPLLTAPVTSRDAYFGLNAYAADSARLFGRSRVVAFNTYVRWQAGQEFIQRPDRKLNLGGNYPALALRTRTGIGRTGFGSGQPDAATRYVFVSLESDYSLDFGLVGRTELRAEAGFFPLQRNVPFVDRQHFRGNQTVLASGYEAGFQLLPYYQYSTLSRYLEAHVSHHFNGFLLNKVPALRQLKWQEVATANFLYTPQVGQYLELGAGIEHIVKLVRVDVFGGYQVGDGAGRAAGGLRVGLGF